VPGYFTTVHHHEDNYLLGVEIVHKVLRRDNALDVMDLVRRSSGTDFQPSVKATLEGQVVITAYNNKTYRVDEVDFDKNPMSTFHLRKENRDITYAEYFRIKYNVVVRNMTQPLLMSRPSRRDMKAVGEVTKLNPQRRVQSLMSFRQRIAGTAKVSFFFLFLTVIPFLTVLVTFWTS